MKKNLLKNSGVQSLLASLACVVLGMLIGYIVLLFINPDGAGEAISTVMKNFLTYSRPDTQAKYLGNTLVKTAPLLMCALAILFAYKVGLFNIGAAGQYCAGTALSLYAALAWGWSWLPCELRATGNNKNAAKYCGMAEKRNIILTLAISGALAGLGASMFYLTGYEQWQCTASSVPGMGFNGIAAAFLGGLHPIGTILASFFIQHITAGGAYVDKTMYCAQISDLIAAVIIYLCGFVLFMKYAMNSAIARREEKAIQKAKAAEQAASQTDTSAEKGGDQ